MFEKVLGSLVVLGLVISTSWAAETQEDGTSTEKAQSIELKPVMEYELPEGEEVVDVIFDEATMTVQEARALEVKGLEQKKAIEKIAVPYPKVLVTNKAVKFLDERGKVGRKVKLREENYEKATISLEMGKIVIIGSKEPYKKYLNLVNEKGVSKKIGEGGEVFTAFVSGNSKYIVSGGESMSALEGCPDCILYDINGNELWRKKTEGDSSAVKILHDGKVLISEFFMDKTRITLIDTNGTQLWKKNLDATPDYEILFTNDGKIIAYAFVTGKLYAFDKKGNLLWQPLNNSVDDLSIPKNTNILYGIGKGCLWAMDINTGNTLWQQKLLDFPVPVKEYDEFYRVSPDGRYVLLKGTFLLDGETGKLLKQIGGSGKFLGTDKIWKMKDNKIEIFNISDILKEGD